MLPAYLFTLALEKSLVCDALERASFMQILQEILKNLRRWQLCVQRLLGTQLIDLVGMFPLAEHGRMRWPARFKVCNCTGIGIRLPEKEVGI